MNTITSLVDTLLLQLAWTSIQATLLIGLLWLLGRALPRLPAPTRCLLWWLLGAQLLVGLAWQTPVSIPLLPPAHVTAAAMQTSQVIRVATQTPSTTAPITATLTPASRVSHALSWREALVALWLAGLIVQLALVARQSERTRRIRRRSKALDDPGLQALCANHAQRLGLRHCPELRVSDAIDSPQVTGLWHPTVLLPARTTLSSAEQAMALAHELAHVRRGDLWLGWIPALAKGLFFFHPLVRLAVREYTLHREAACDGRAVRLQQTGPRAYGQLLLRLGIEQPLPVGLAGVASPSFRQLKRRLALLQYTANTMPRARDWLLVALVAFAFVMPYRLVAASPDAHDANQTVVAHASPLPRAAGCTVATGNSSTACRQAAQHETGPCEGTGADNICFGGSHFLVYAQPPESGRGIVFFDEHRVIIHGTHADVVAAKHFYKPNASALWFRRGDKRWVTRDTKVIARARQIYAPAVKRIEQSTQLAYAGAALASKQSAIASQQAAFAQKQAALARQRGALARIRATLARNQASVARREIASPRKSNEPADTNAAGKIDADRNAITRRRHALDVQRHALDVQHARLAKLHSELEAKLEPQRETLARQRDQLTKQRHALTTHRKQAEAATHEAMQQLLDDVLAKGLAKPASHD